MCAREIIRNVEEINLRKRADVRPHNEEKDNGRYNEIRSGGEILLCRLAPVV